MLAATNDRLIKSCDKTDDDCLVIWQVTRRWTAKTRLETSRRGFEAFGPTCSLVRRIVSGLSGRATGTTGTMTGVHSVRDGFAAGQRLSCILAAQSPCIATRPLPLTDTPPRPVP